MGEAVEHKGYSIQPTPFSADGQFQTCAVITKEVDGVVKEHRLVRADRFPSADLAADQAIRKGRQVIDEQGDRIFD
ncbi:HlyU family transcriptional regulator [Nitratireductor sp. GISD-1A_MAKvit]|uniref:HlyU family transcriptional regulator n=1 Tax=Nitratireductor sp. GISD-1A_MAKvit TaxID=3234198 RepID=UPI003465CC11